MESLCQVYPPHTVYEPPSLLPFSLQLGGKLIYCTLSLLLMIATIGGKTVSLV
jgi:hypothetical protein